MSDSNNKLILLRKFALIDGYSKEYLSQLVQRKRLKAKKIGHNYFTTRQWFEEYLEFYAREDKSAEIKKNLIQISEFSEQESTENIDFDKSIKLTDNKVGFFLPKNFIFKSSDVKKIASIAKYLLAPVLIVIIVFFLASIYFSNKTKKFDSGQVAGTSEPINTDKGEFKESFVSYRNSLYRITDSVSTLGKEIFMMEKVGK